MRSNLLLAGLLAIGCALPSYADAYKIDPAHSSANFSVKHLMISNVSGQFSKVNGTVEYDPKNPKAAKVEATIDVSTVDTHEPKRDDHLKSPEFFDTAKFPTMTFKSTKVLSAAKGHLKLAGDLTIHGVTKEVTLNVDGPSDSIKDPKGKERRGASATTTIDRKEFGLTWNKAMDNGGVMIGEQIPITIDVEMMQEPKVAEAK
jgi:polyisoprenoid-binding protein YceI